MALDGKTVCGSRDGENTALHMNSAFATCSGLCLDQEGTRGTGHEITSIKALLGSLNIKGCIVTIEAICCRAEIAKKIIDQGGDYLLAPKDNQETLAPSLREFFAEGGASGFGTLPVSSYSTVGKHHGQIETRNHLRITDLTWLARPIRQHWPKLEGVGRVDRVREIKGKTSTERAFYNGSKGIANAETYATAARSHWGIENKLHWVLDVTFREDDCRVRKGHAPQHLSTFREFALTLLRQDQPYPRRSLRNRRKTMHRITGYRASLLGLLPLVKMRLPWPKLPRPAYE